MAARGLLLAVATAALVSAARIRGTAKQQVLQGQGVEAGAEAGFFGHGSVDRFDDVPADSACPLHVQQAIVEAFTPASIACERSLGDVFAMHPRALSHAADCPTACGDALRAKVSLPRTAFPCMVEVLEGTVPPFLSPALAEFIRGAPAAARSRCGVRPLRLAVEDHLLTPETLDATRPGRYAARLAAGEPPSRDFAPAPSPGGEALEALTDSLGHTGAHDVHHGSVASLAHPVVVASLALKSALIEDFARRDAVRHAIDALQFAVDHLPAQPAPAAPTAGAAPAPVSPPGVDAARALLTRYARLYTSERARTAYGDILPPSASPTPSTTHTPHPSHSFSATATASHSEPASHSPTAHPSVSGSETGTASHTRSPVPTHSVGASPTGTPAHTPSSSDTPAHTPSATLSAVHTPSPSLSAAATPSSHPTTSGTPTETETATETVTASHTHTPTETETATHVPVSHSPTESSSPVHSPSAAAVVHSPSATETETASPAHSASHTETETGSPAHSPSPSSVAHSVSATETETGSPAHSPSPSSVAHSVSATETETASPAHSPSPSSVAHSVSATETETASPAVHIAAPAPAAPLAAASPSSAAVRFKAQRGANRDGVVSVLNLDLEAEGAAGAQARLDAVRAPGAVDMRAAAAAAEAAMSSRDSAIDSLAEEAAAQALSERVAPAQAAPAAENHVLVGEDAASFDLQRLVTPGRLTAE